MVLKAIFNCNILPIIEPMKIILGLMLLMLNLSSFQPAGEKLVLKIEGLRSNKGYVLVSVFKGSEGYPDKHEKAFRKFQLKINNKVATVDISSIPDGEYAIAILHDENHDGKMNTNWIGWPKEGFGFSNNVMGTFGPPSFNKAKISYKGDALQVNIRTKYF
jgi:uncharacterized protein (DUF2141 family)